MERIELLFIHTIENNFTRLLNDIIPQTQKPKKSLAQSKIKQNNNKEQYLEHYNNKAEQQK